MLDADFKKKLIWQIIGVVAIVGVGALFFLLLRGNIVGQTDMIVGLKRQRYMMQGASQNFSQLVMDAKIARQYQAAIDALVPTENDVLSLQKNLQDVAKTHGVVLNMTFGQEAPPNAAGLKIMSFTATAEGALTNVISFLESVESDYQYLRIDALEINAVNRRATLSGIVTFSE